MHCHMHVIPRYHGDTLNPRGGIRKVVKNEKKILNCRNHLMMIFILSFLQS